MKNGLLDELAGVAHGPLPLLPAARRARHSPGLPVRAPFLPVVVVISADIHRKEKQLCSGGVARPHAACHETPMQVLVRVVLHWVPLRSVVQDVLIEPAPQHASGFGLEVALWVQNLRHLMLYDAVRLSKRHRPSRASLWLVCLPTCQCSVSPPDTAHLCTVCNSVCRAPPLALTNICQRGMVQGGGVAADRLLFQQYPNSYNITCQGKHVEQAKF